jgi:TonB family protein
MSTAQIRASHVLTLIFSGVVHVFFLCLIVTWDEKAAPCNKTIHVSLQSTHSNPAPKGPSFKGKNSGVSRPSSPVAAVVPLPSDVSVPGSELQSSAFRHARPDAIEKPKYTPRARAKLIEGDVVLSVRVDKNGRVQSASVKQKLGFGLDEAALQAILRSRFEPALDEHGNPTEEEVDYRFKFVLHNAA